MRRHHTGSGRRTVFHPDWETHQAPVAEQFMLEAVVNLRKPGGTPTWNEGLGRTVVTPFTSFAINVPASIQPITAGGGAVGVVEEQVYVLGYRVAVPRSTAPTSAQLDEGVEVLVVSCSDPMLVGQTLKVNDVLRGVHRLQRILYTNANS